jgi:diadenosine tetraphosphatase ApaH/serine/threonine PP2A family protein phosphatase
VNSVGELKQFGLAHARAQRIPAKLYWQVCERIVNDEDGGPGSWTGEWCDAAMRLVQKRNPLMASGYFNLARFPYVDGPARSEALKRCVESFGRWADGHGVERLELKVMGGTVCCWAGGLSDSAPRPLLLVMGGIISVKEQWGTLASFAKRLNMAILMTEIPRVGENTLRYDSDSWNFLSAILDEVAGRADVSRTYAMTLSFSGHMALRCAATDHRIRGILTIAAPVAGFFVDEAWQRQLPQITLDTLCHLTGLPSTDLHAEIQGWALTIDDLEALDIPVRYVGSGGDEIVPASDLRMLREHVKDLKVLEYDDEHAGPRNATETRLWVFLELLKIYGVRSPLADVLKYAWYALKVRRRFLEAMARRSWNGR